MGAVALRALVSLFSFPFYLFLTPLELESLPPRQLLTCSHPLKNTLIANPLSRIVPILAGIPFGWGCLAIFISATTYLVDVYQAANGASAVAANGILRYGLGAAFPLFTLQMVR